MGMNLAGIIDDIHGADFVNGGNDGNIQDQNGHGTFVAGVVGAVTNNALGVAGMNQVSSHASTIKYLLNLPPNTTIVCCMPKAQVCNAAHSGKLVS
jgi:subtilisin family serine protease